MNAQLKHTEPNPHYVIWGQMLNADVALQALDEAGCTIESITLSAQIPVIRLANAPAPGVIPQVLELARGQPGAVERVMRANYLGCRVEWLA